jgi:hypothetical protein
MLLVSCADAASGQARFDAVPEESLAAQPNQSLESTGELCATPSLSTDFVHRRRFLSAFGKT